MMKLGLILFMGLFLVGIAGADSGSITFRPGAGISMDETTPGDAEMWGGNVNNATNVNSTYHGATSFTGDIDMQWHNFVRTFNPAPCDYLISKVGDTGGVGGYVILTDSSGTVVLNLTQSCDNDEMVLNAAISNASIDGGAKIFNSAQLWVDTEIQIDSINYLEIEGGSIASDADITVLSITDSWFVTLRNMWVERYNYDSDTGHPFQIHDTSNVYLDNLIVWNGNASHAVNITDDATDGNHDYWIFATDCYFYGDTIISNASDNFWENTIFNAYPNGTISSVTLLDNANSNHFTNCHFMGVPGVSGGTAIEIGSTDFTSIIGGNIDGGLGPTYSEMGVYISGGSQTEIVGSQIYNIDDFGVRIHNSTLSMIDAVAFLNINKGNNYGNDVVITGSLSKYNSISDCRTRRTENEANKGYAFAEADWDGGAPDYNNFSNNGGNPAQYAAIYSPLGAHSSAS